MTMTMIINNKYKEPEKQIALKECPFCNQALQPINVEARNVEHLEDYYFCRTCWAILNIKIKWKVMLPYERPKNT